MPRSKFLPCIMTPGIINSISEKQRHYDENPERAEREQQRRREEREREEYECRREQESSNDTD